MFTGIVDHVGTLVAVTAQTNAMQCTIACDFTALELGESIAVDGICLTVTAIQPQHFSCDISPETLSLTTAAAFKVGNKINLERALRVGDRLGGHWVMGHVDQTAMLQAITTHQDFVEMQIGGLNAAERVFLIKKGSIAVNGVSLTVNEVTTDGFKVMLVPHTLQRTNLSQLKVGNKVNLEFDWMVRTVISQFNRLELSNA